MILQHQGIQDSLFFRTHTTKGHLHLALFSGDDGPPIIQRGRVREHDRVSRRVQPSGPQRGAVDADPERNQDPQ